MTVAEYFLNQITRNELGSILNIQNVLLFELQKFAYKEGFKQIMPVMLSKITDPLNHSTYPAEIKYLDKRLKLTSSMIFHKQIALIQKKLNKILIMAPNIRLEMNSSKNAFNHLIEFTQYDIEIKNANMFDVMAFIERLYVYIFDAISKQCCEDLKILNCSLPSLKIPFPRFSTIGVAAEELEKFYFEISNCAKMPTFITNFKREFYDKEDTTKPGTYLNFDMVYPYGYGEGLSGAEREYQYENIVRRMKELDMDLGNYSSYLDLANKGLIQPSAGCGIGIERLLRFICGKQLIKDVCLFDRSIQSSFIF